MRDFFFIAALCFRKCFCCSFRRIMKQNNLPCVWPAVSPHGFRKSVKRCWNVRSWQSTLPVSVYRTFANAQVPLSSGLLTIPNLSMMILSFFGFFFCDILIQQCRKTWFKHSARWQHKRCHETMIYDHQKSSYCEGSKAQGGDSFLNRAVLIHSINKHFNSL